MKTNSLATLLSSTLAALLVGCAGADNATSDVQATNASLSGSEYLLNNEPENPQTVLEARESAQDGDQVAVLGRVGGSGNPWIEGRAAFSVVDTTLQACSDIPGDGCPTPWDYCCEVPALPGATALVKIVDADGNVVKADAKELLNLKELDTVVARGTAQRDDAGNLTVLATGIYVQK